MTMEHPTLQQSILFMMTAHEGQTDMAGLPYFYHPLRVMLRLGPDATEAERHAALLHDVMEDCGFTREILLDLGYTDEEVTLIEKVSRLDKSVSYRQFIYSIIGSELIGAMRIKLADLYDNQSKARIELLPPDKRAKVEEMIAKRYKPATSMILQCLGDHARGVIPDDIELDVDVKELLHGE